MLQQAEIDESALPIIVDSYRIDLATARMLLLREEKSLFVHWLFLVTLLLVLSLSVLGWREVVGYGVFMALLSAAMGVYAWNQRRKLPATVLRDHPLLMLACGQLCVEQGVLQDAPLRVVVPATDCCIRRLRRRRSSGRDFTAVQIPLPSAWLLGPTLHVPVYDRVPGAREFCRALRSAGAEQLPRCGLLRYWRETFFGAPCIDTWERLGLRLLGAQMSLCTILQAFFPQARGIQGAFVIGSSAAFSSVMLYRHRLSTRRRSRSNDQILQPELEPSSYSGDSGSLAAV